MKTLTLKVKGMHCPSCEMLIKDSLEETPGIKKAELNYKKGTAIVEFDEKKASREKIKEVISKEGYKVE